MSATQPLPHLKVLHIEDSEPDHALVVAALRKHWERIDVRRIERWLDLTHALAQPDFDVILADFHLPGFTAMQAWDLVRNVSPSTPFVLVSGAIGEAAAVAAVKAGMSDYVMKDDLGPLRSAIQGAMSVKQAEVERNAAQEQLELSKQRLSELTSHLQEAIEEERLRFARDIHDDLGSALTAIKLDLATALRQADPLPARSHVESALETVQQAVLACQRIAFDMRPPILDEGIGPALHWLVDNLRQRTSIKIRLTESIEDTGLPPALALTAYRTAQEGLNNALKHAQCASIAIDLSVGGGVLTVDLRDDGTGMAPQSDAKKGAFGLRGLHERAAAAGGWLDVSSQPGRGTALTLVIPYQGTRMANGAGTQA